MCMWNTSHTPSDASRISATDRPPVFLDATIVLTAAVSSGVAAYRFAPFAATCDSHCSSASAIVSGRVDRPTRPPRASTRARDEARRTRETRASARARAPRTPTSKRETWPRPRASRQ